MKVSHYAVKHPVVIAMFLIALVAFGIFCLFGLNFEFIPDISLPEVEIITIYPGASAEDVEQDITTVLEDNFVTLPNFKSISSKSSNSLSWITVIYQDGVDVYDQLTELRYRIDQLEDSLPSDANKPYALVGGATMLPVIQFAIIGGNDTGRITQYINDTLTPMLTKIDGVADVSMYGDAVSQIEINLRMDDVQSKGISILQVYQVLSASNFTIPLGSSSYMGKNINMKYDGTISGLEEIKNLPVGMGTDNVMVYLRDIANISVTYPENTNYVLSEGSNLVMVSVTKRASGNTVKINSQIKEVLEDMVLSTNGALNYRIYSDDSGTIFSSLSTVLESGILGVIIAIIIIFLFLNNTRATLVIASSIPLSILFTFIAMKIGNYTINLMTTSSFVVALGMIVDGSIVMLEQVFSYLGKGGFSDDNAIFMGSDEVGASILASALTTMVVFIPICFLNGVMGMILNGFAVVLVLCIGASLIVSIVVVPFLIKVLVAGHYKEPRETLFIKLYNKIEELYKRALKWSLINRTYVIVVPVLLLLLSFLLIPGLGYSFIPSVDTGEFYVNLAFPKGYSLDQSKEKALYASEIVSSCVPEKEGLALFVGMSDAMGGNFSSHPENAYMYVTLKSGDRRRVQDIILEVQEQLSASVPDCTVTVTNGGFDKLVGYIASGGGYAINLVGQDLDLLYNTATEIRAFLAQDKDVTGTSIGMTFDDQALSITMNQNSLNSLGITSYEAGMVSAIIFNGVDVGKLTLEDGSRQNIFLCSDIALNNIDNSVLTRIPLTTLSGSTITFADLGSLEMTSAVSSISHSERSLTVSVNATLVSEDTSGVNSRMNDYFANNPLPSGITIENSGIMGLISDSLGSMITAIVIALFLVYMVMVIQFEHFRQPFIIFLSIPFCLIGVIVCLLVFGSSLTLMGMISVVALSGIVVNNAIILVDYINQIRDRKRASIILDVPEEEVDKPGSPYTQEEGRNKILDLRTEESILALSIVQGGSSRLRPILMTTLTTLFGVFPMAFAIGEGAEIYASVGQTISGGLLTSTLITLFIIPVLYYVFEHRSLVKTIEKRETK